MGNPNLDDVMQSNRNFKNSLMASGSLKRPIPAIRTKSPLVRQVNDNASPTPPMTTRHNLDPVPKFRGSLRDMDLKTDASPVNGHGWKGKKKTENSFQHRTKQRKRDEPIISTKVKDILEWRTMKPETVERQHHGNAKQAAKATGGIRDLWKSRRIGSLKNKGPKAGQVYEIVNQHIIEDSMDRTVTISTWRERVDEGCDLDTDTMSVYYISPGGYAREDAHMAEVNTNLGRQGLLLGSRHGSKTETQSSTPYPEPVEAYTSGGPKSSTTAKSRADYRHAQYFDLGTDLLESKNTASDKKKHTRSGAKEGGVPINPARDSLAQLKVPDEPFMQRQRHYQESTPIEKELPPTPFHPTRSGSTISSIRSVSTTEFEKFLDGCKPSLVHVSGILKNLGMYKLEHLKAVARLSPEMRDREVKEVALRLGMTVVEWAILVDELLRSASENRM